MSDQKPDSEADETLLRENSDDAKTNSQAGGEADSLKKSEGSSSAETIVRSNVGSTGNPAAETVVRNQTGLAADENRHGNGANQATILRDSSTSEAEEEETLLRNAASPVPDAGDATILRDPGDASATILSYGEDVRKAAASSSTILRDSGSDDPDATEINIPEDADATLIGGGGDTTFAAALGPEKPRGNTEAGRLLKNRFVLEEKVGSGGMGDVYKALDLRQQEAQERNPYIAIKILNESFARHKDAFISLQRETTRTRGIPHPNIMAVYDFDKEGETVFMSMELLDGKPLDDYLRDHPEGVSTEDAWNIIDGICQGLGRAHGAGIVHSDFKPGNIYYTTDKTCKVFDFGIARAVTNPGELEADGEKTVFDAGSLGALTPAYASYEMLKGLEPTKSDDVYAVALVAYELFTGKHPYNRVPADKALERGLEPEVPTNLKRRHWRVLKKALEIKGENRTQSIDEFYEGMFSEDPPYFRYTAIAAVLVVSIGFGVYQQFFRAAEELPEGYQEFMSSYTSANSGIRSRLTDKNLEFDSEGWHRGISEGINQMSLAKISLVEEYPEDLPEGWEETADKEIRDQQKKIMNAYLDEVGGLRSSADEGVVDTNDKIQVQNAIETLAIASELLARVKDNYNFDSEKVTQEEVRLVSRGDLREFQLETIISREDAEAEAARVRDKNEVARREAADKEAERYANYDLALEKFRNILRCKGDIENIELYGENGLEGVIRDLSETYPERFQVDKEGFVAAIAGCIQQRVAVRAPARARTIKAAVTGYLPGERILSDIEIVDLDPCAKLGLAGQGSRNRRWCEDQLAVGGSGPELVVIPGKQSARNGDPLGLNFAISRVEVRIGDYNQFCLDTGCSRLEGPSALPATNVSLDQAKAYAAWLSDQSGKVYRIPTEDEWLYAATTNGTAEVDQNVNCTVDSRGVRLGERLLNTLSGKPNSWGLYNHVGNAREWATSGEELVALGGAHTDPKAECTMAKRVVHSGQSDPVTGFRLYRKIQDSEELSETKSAD